MHTKRLKLCRNDRANCRNGYTLEALDQFRFSAGGAGDFAELATWGALVKAIASTRPAAISSITAITRASSTSEA